VSAGEYVENIDFTGKDISLIGNPDNPEEVVIDGGGDGSVVVFSNGETNEAVLSGFTLQNGGNVHQGGGVYCNNSYPNLLNLIVRENMSASGGGGIYYSGDRESLISMENLQVIGNQSSGAAGIMLYEGEISISNSTISNNSSQRDAGGIWCGENTISTFDNLIITDNDCSRDGGGIYYINHSEASLSNSHISGNVAGAQGGGLFLSCWENEDGILSLHNCEIYENTGRSVIYFAYASVQIDHVTLHHNISHHQIINLTNSECVFNNCTVSDSRTGWFIVQAECSTVIQNSIVYNNDIWGLFPEQGELAEITFSNIQGGFEGEGNIDADPQFVDAENGDYQLTEDSPCIDVGNPDSDPDPDGTRVDMGVYYFHQEVRVLNVPDEFETIQAAIDAAEDGDEIRVSAGDYVENINFSGKDISIIGDPDSPESVIIDGNDNGSVVIFEEGEGEGAVLSGFTVRNGNSEFGGGIHGTGTSITLQNLIVTGNFIENGFGAGIYVNNCNLNIVNSEFSGNDAISNGQSLGGGIAIIENSQFEISETVVSNNLAWRGAGLYIQQSEGSLSNLDISENSGSGLTIDGCSPQVTDVVIRNNDFIAGRNDGATGIDVRGGNPIFNRVIITNNTMTSGGAVMVLGESTPEFNYCEISNNICEQGEGSNGIVAMGGHPIINNTTIYGHSFTGLYLRDTGSAIITNSIFWTNEDFSIYNAEGSWGFEIDYSDVEGGIDGMFRGDVNGAVFGENNIDSDPFFTDPDNNDFHLAANSACIDAGDPDTDPDPDGTRADMGAYYFHRDEDGILNVPDEYATIQAAINAAHDGAEVRVAPGGGNGENGAYMENINFNGKNISLIGDPDDPTSVVIDGNQNGSVVTFENWETNDAILTGFTITNGTGTDFNDGGGRRGGGVYSQPSSPTITYCIFRGNDADDGGAIHSRAPEGEMTSISIQNCQIFDNNTNSGGTIILARSEVVIYNTEITNNVGYQGAAIDCYWSDVTISNCTIANNIASENHNGGTIWSFMSEVDFTNSIAWGNGENHMVLWDSDVFNINYSDLQGGENNIDNTRGAQLNWGGNNIDSDPLFSDPDNSEYHLSANSPCIDTGDPESEPDPDGTRADMGAYYYNQEDEPDIEVSPEFLEFPATILGEASDFILTISNNGDANLTVSNISTQAPFSVAFGGELVIEPAQEHEVTVTFIPEESIEFDGLLMISSNDPVNPEIEVPLSGVGVSINNPPEVIREISDITVDEDPGRVDVINLDEVFVDPDEDELTFTFAGAPEELNVRIDDGNVLFFEPVENFNLPDGVEITVTADDGQDDNRDFGKIRQSRTVRGVSEGTDIESVNFTLLETDDSILSPQRDANVSTSFVIIITPVNDAPYVMDPIEDVVREEDSGYFAIADINEYFHDVDIDFEGDALNYTFRGDPEEVNMQIQENGWLTIDPDENYYLNEPVEIIVTAEDDHRATTITVFHLMIDAVNDVPVVVNEIGDVTVNEDCGHTIIADLDDVFYDPDGDDLEFSLNDGDVPDELNLLINDNNLLLFEPEDNFNMPEGIEVVVTADDGAENRMLRIALSSNVPDTNFNQAVNTDRDTRSVRKIAADISSKNSPRRDDSVEDSFMLVVRAINDAPVVQMEIPDITLEFNPGYVAIADLDDIFFDPDVITDDDLLRYTISEIPGELNINITEQNVLSVDPEGDFELPDGVDIVIIARDNENAVALAEFNLTINRPIHWDEPVETDFRHVFSISECDLYLEDQFGPLPDGSNIGAFTPDSLCVGHVVWDNDGVDLIAYGNNPDTEEIDGFIEGESVHFRVIEGFDQRELLGRIEYINEEPVRTYTVDSETSINLQVAGSSNSCNIIQLLHYDPVESNAQETHSILIEEVTLDDELLEIGDEIGAFAQDRMCVGATIFIGVPNDENEPWLESLRVGFSAVPDDNRTHELDGFEDGDEMYFEIWDHSSNTTYFAAVEFLAGDEHFVRHGRSRVNIRATRIFEQRIELTGDWQMISTHLVDLVRESIIDMWADVVEREHLEILKDHHGNFYLPDWGFNNIPRWRTEYGYQVKCSAEDMLIIRGRAVVDPDDSIHLRVGWSIIAYYLQEDVDAIIAFDNLVEVEVPDEMNGFQPAEIVTFLEIAKDAWGNFYLPEWNFCNLGDLRPDRAYQVKVSDDVDFVWSTGDLFIASGENELIIPEPIFFKTPELTNSNMSLLITKAPTSSDRYELGVISSSNVCIGSIVIDGDGPWGIALWGDDETTTSLDGAKEGEQFEFRIWDGNTEYSMSPEFQGGSNSFEKDGLGVVTFDNQLVPNEFSITSVYPNPFNSTAMVTYSLDEHASIAVKLFDLTGCEIATLYEGQRAPGNHTLQITGQNYASGLYLCRLIKNSNGQKATRKVVLIK
ncbi:MAG: T9SS type A sorting domain-containing protein, partial [Calditrichaeota bacterium]|nr:T9SS type A sorting domain-containing protein [Calditrichota bacterium]